jgi:hypothetical protein
VEIPSGLEPEVVPVSAEFTLNPQTASVRVIVRDKRTDQTGSLDLQLQDLRKE